MAIFCGAAGNKFLFSGQNKYVTCGGPDSIKKALMDPASVENSSKEESTKLRAYLPPFSSQSPCNIIPVMDEMAKEHSINTGHPIMNYGPHYQKKNEILEKRKTVASDLVDCMLMDGMTEVEIGNKIVGFFIASHDTTSTAITFIVSYLSDHPEVYIRVLKVQQMEVLRSKEGGSLRWEDIQKMKYTWCVACEVMRLAPPANGSFREAITDFTYAGVWTVHTTNKNPTYFPDPERFDPSRFEGNGPAPYTFVPFGGGPRMCPGKEYARLEILTSYTTSSTVQMGQNQPPREDLLHPFSHSRGGPPISIQPMQINDCSTNALPLFYCYLFFPSLFSRTMVVEFKNPQLLIL
ncbi:Beta-amyrin 28-oxidase [Hibiscus syriacus]|uniref:Beta-amyrin 28-oxidase n=1 Tax=Hibiscus syriacus TaxID=106335 RepID=A0A6A2YPH5_HIBSY|nr:Beta-amyrin 28-oxidase [Hibiscus syriacus]